ncbi:hypothetical protein [Streptomyces mirabilis]|uniref:hypothetical protein n=1 Tax=Streptomyces mirabilis TaxID=68239 RepID=UPI003822F7B9
MQTFTSTELNRKSGAILQAARDQGSVEIRKGAEVYVLQYVRTDEDATTYVRNDAVRTEGDPWKDEMLSLMRELVEQGRGVSGGDNEKFAGPSEGPANAQAAQVADPGKVTARIDEEPVQNRPVVIPEAVQAPEPEKPGEPSPDELKAAYDYLGLRECPEGLEITEKGIQSALGTVKKAAREDPSSAEAKVMAMGSADEDRIEFLRCVQIDKLSKALAKRAAGDPRWLSVATPTRI